MDTRAERLRDLLTNKKLWRAGIRSKEHGKPPTWNRQNLSGRLNEISGNGALTIAFGLVLETQTLGEPVAWVTRPSCIFYPPDVEKSGVDLDSLAVIRVPTVRDVARAADRLIRSGAFGLAVLDLGKDAEISYASQGRLVGLAQKYDTVILCLTDKTGDAPSLGSMVSLRANVLREQVGVDHFRCKVKVLKDKQRGPNWEYSEEVRGPAGMR